MKPISLRAARAIVTKENIYDAALTTFEEKGYKDTTIAEITERAGTAKGTFYLYFKSKSDLVYHTIERYDKITVEAYQSVAELPTFREQFTNYMLLYYHNIKKMGKEILKALYWENIMDHEPMMTRPTREIYYSVQRMVEFGLRTGELSPDYPVAYYVRAIISNVQGIDYFWCSESSNNTDIEELGIANAQFLCNGLLHCCK